jgi:uncharacterized membrane protein
MIPAIATVARGDGSGIVQPRRAIVRDEAEWRALWAAHAGPEMPAPAVDFRSRMVAAVFAGERATPGFEIEIAAARHDGAALILAVAERPPARRVAAQIVVAPFHIVTVPRHDGAVHFADYPLRPASAQGPRVTPDAASSTGLDPNFAAALSYLAGPFSGLLILLVERANAYVRFHAWQAVVGLGGLGLLAIALLGFSFLTLLLSPFAFTVMYRLSAVIAVLWLVVWVVCLVKAFTGSTWKMPIAGRYAERLAARPS